jgi:ribosomal-protein-alanine N-acetyltransferase
MKDLEDILFLRSDPTVNKYIDRSPAQKLKDAEDFFNKISKGFDEGKNINWTITYKDNDKMIGSICLWNFSEDEKIGEVGYDLKPEFQGQGIMTEALKAILNFGFEQLKLEKIEAYTHHQNESSKRLLVKNNFKIIKGKIDEYNSNNIVFQCEPFHVT